MPTTDSLDRFLDLSSKLHLGMISAPERDEWRGLLHALVEGEVGARSRLHPEEGRRHLRTAIRLPASVSGPGGFKAELNVSLGTGGLRVHSALPFVVGDVLRIEIGLSDRVLAGRAKLVWHHTESSGVELLDLGEADRNALEGAVVEAMLQLK